MPPKAKEILRPIPLTVRVSPTLGDAIDEASDAAGMSISEYVRTALALQVGLIKPPRAKVTRRLAKRGGTTR